MRKTAIIGISILSVFILCSLSYQPIIADTPIETITQANKSKASNLDVDEIKELYIKLLELKSQSDCGCETVSKITGFWNFPTMCTFLLPLVLFFIYMYLTREKFYNLSLNLLLLGEKLDCWWVQPWLNSFTM